jgi:hypothetical protein
MKSAEHINEELGIQRGFELFFLVVALLFFAVCYFQVQSAEAQWEEVTHRERCLNGSDMFRIMYCTPEAEKRWAR